MSELPDIKLRTSPSNNFYDYIQISTSAVVSQEEAINTEIGVNSWSSPLELTTDDDIYVSCVTYHSNGIDDVDFALSIEVDGVSMYRRPVENLSAGYFSPNRNINLGKLSAGEHIITIRLDDTDLVEESDENNTYSLKINVEQGEYVPAKYLIKSSWAQKGDGEMIYGYNMFLKNNYVTGCVPTAVGQILYYWAMLGYDVALSIEEDDFFKYYADGTWTTVTAGTNLQEECGISLYELNEILSDVTYDQPNSDTDNDIAALGLAGMLILNSSAVSNSTSTTLKTDILDRANFNSQYIQNVTDTTWRDIKTNVLDGKPVIISSNVLEHALILDGFNMYTDEFHLNFGWGEAILKEQDENSDYCIGNGWYTMEEIEALNVTHAIINIAPDYEPPSLESTTGNTITDNDMEDATSGAILTIDSGSIWIPMKNEAGYAHLSIIGNTSIGTLQFQSEDGSTKGASIQVPLSIPATNAALIMNAENDDVKDVFLARAQGIWSNGYDAQHNGYIMGDIVCKGTEEKVNLYAKNVFQDIFRGNFDANMLFLTDDYNGDALFLEDMYSHSGDQNERGARISEINEIFAGSGNDIIDLTSQKYECFSYGITFHGGDGDDVIWANIGENIIFGDGGNDSLVGADANDTIIGGTGNDIMNGLGGNDVFCFGENWGQDTVTQSADGSVTLIFADGIEGTWSDSTFTSGDNSVAVSGCENITVYIGTEKICGSSEVEYSAFEQYCIAQDSSSSIYITKA